MGRIDPRQVQCKTGERLILRSATLQDADKMNDLATEVFKTSSYLITTPEEFSSFSEEQQRDRLKKYEDESGSILLVVEHNDVLIGMIDFQNGRRPLYSGPFDEFKSSEIECRRKIT